VVSSRLSSEIPPESLDPIEIGAVGGEKHQFYPILEVLQIGLGGSGSMGRSIVTSHKEEMVRPHLHQVIQMTREIRGGLAGLNLIETFSAEGCRAAIEIGDFIPAWGPNHGLASQRVQSSGFQIRAEMEIGLVLEQEDSRLRRTPGDIRKKPALCLTQLPFEGFFSNVSIRCRLA